MSGALPDPSADPAADDAFAITLPPRPYPGLRPFEDSEWPIFFGRERMVDAVVSRLVSGQFVVVHGDSGSGKSSLIFAGVLPRLRQEQARGGARWRTVSAMPRGGPLRNLAQALAALDGRADDAERVLALRRALNQGRHAPAALAELMLADDHDHLCILIDQFEELFEHARLQGGGEARLLTDALVALAGQPPRGLYVALTMRSEYLGACARFPGLAEAVNLHQYLLPPMAVADLLRAIREPARLYGGEVDAALAERLAADAAGIDGLPLVQHGLMQMQREHGATEPWRLTLAHYPADGLAAQLSRHADAVAQQASAAVPQRERLVEDLFRALTAVNAEGHAVRRPQPLAGLAEALQVDVPTLARAIDPFRADGVSFLVPREARALQPDDWIDICHEALIRCWRQLAEPQDGWLAREFRNGLVWRALLVQAESFEREASNVLSPTTTEERVRWLQRRNPVWAERYGGGWNRVQALVEASEARRRGEMTAQRRQRGFRQAAVVVVLVLSGLVVTQLWSNYQVRQQQLLTAQQRALAEARTRELDATNQTLDATNQANVALLEKTRASADDLKSVLLQLNEQAGRTRSLDVLRRAVHDATAQLAGTASVLQQAVADNEVPPRVYVHIANEGQRRAAEDFGRAFGQLKLGAVPVVALGPQLVARQQNKGVLRCFRNEECGPEADALLQMANGLLASPTLQKQDLSANYDASSRPRPHHFEIWFGQEAIRLRSPPAVPAAAQKG